MKYTLYDWNGEFQGRVETNRGEPDPKLARYIIEGHYSAFTKLVDGEVVEIGDDLLQQENAVVARRKRNKLLQDSDHTQLPDSPRDASVWAEYRQKLRDLPEQEGFPNNITWPTKPE